MHSSGTTKEKSGKVYSKSMKGKKIRKRGKRKIIDEKMRYGNEKIRE